jgi:hypothetical protein
MMDDNPNEVTEVSRFEMVKCISRLSECRAQLAAKDADVARLREILARERKMHKVLVLQQRRLPKP